MTKQILTHLKPATEADRKFMTDAYRQAELGYKEGGVPVGAVMVKKGVVVCAGRNRRVQEDDPVLHGETDCLRAGGIRKDYSEIDLYTTLSPCMMCVGAILNFGIKRVIIGECENFQGFISTLTDHGVEVVLLDDDACKNLMSKFIDERPELWFEDIGNA